MKETTPRLTEKEAQIMRLLWEHGPMTVRTMLGYYPAPAPHFNTVSTTVRILEEKGFAGHTAEGNTYRYFAAVGAEHFGERSLAQVVRNFFSNNYASVVSSLVRQEKVSADELREILRAIEEGKEE